MTLLLSSGLRLLAMFVLRTLTLVLPLGMEMLPEAGARAGAEGVPIPPHLSQPPLADALVTYRALSDDGGWPVIQSGPSLRRGDAGERVAMLRDRIGREHHLPPGSNGQDARVFDAHLEAAVREFQRRNGLEQDGIVGPMTLAALNVSASDRVAQIELNLARLRMLPAQLGDPYVAVNVAAQLLQVVQADDVPLTSRIVVGKPSTPTPALSSVITKVVFNPPWNVPVSIAANEVLPRLRQEPQHLLNENMIIVDRPEDPHGLAIDWSIVSLSQFATRLRQLPGPDNALGRIKFEFPNRYSVYLHDTPAKRLFERERRTFSHGCMRMEHPRDLAVFLLRDQGWGMAEIEAVIAQGQTREVPLQHAIPVWVLYLTAFVEDGGVLHFREDVYGWDARDLAVEEGAALSGVAQEGCFG